MDKSHVPLISQSWQLWLLKFFLKLPFKKKIKNAHDILNIRKRFESKARYFKQIAKTQREAFNIEGLEAEWISPTHVTPKAVIFYLHGGGYCFGSINTHRIYLSYLSRLTHTAILVINYRLAPEFPFPAALEDAYKAYSWLIAQEQRPIFMAGDSAGGGLALSLLLKLKAAQERLPVANIYFSPWLDLSHQGQSYKENAHLDLILPAPTLPIIAQFYAGKYNVNLPGISPIYGDLQDLPPFFVQVGTSEILLSDSLQLAQKSIKGRVEVWEGMLHAWQIFAPYLPESKKALRSVRYFLRNLSC